MDILTAKTPEIDESKTMQFDEQLAGYIEAEIMQGYGLNQVRDTLIGKGYNAISVKDNRDGNTYNAVTIGDQTWFAENLRYLPVVHSNKEFTLMSDQGMPGYGVYGYDGPIVVDAKEEINYTNFGVLYNWYAVDQVDVCPTNWHVPSDDEWSLLSDFITSTGHVNDIGVVLKSTTGWNHGRNGSDTFGFNAIAGGTRYTSDGRFEMLGLFGSYWSSSKHSSNINNAWFRSFEDTKSDIQRANIYKKSGVSIRCLKD